MSALKLYRVAYRNEVFIWARNERQAEDIFEGYDPAKPSATTWSLARGESGPDEPGVAGPEEYVEIVSLEEYPPDFLI
jgi:hypothetical protein